MHSINRLALSSLAAAAFAVGLSACGPRSTGTPAAKVEQRNEQGSTTLPAPTDAAVVRSVKAALANEPQLKSMSVDVEANAGKVTLKGSAPDSASRDRAGQVVASVRGVTSVDNQLEEAGS